MKALKNFLRTIFHSEGEDDVYVPTPMSAPTVQQNYERFADLLPYTAWLDDERLFVLEGEETDKMVGLGFCLEMRPQTGASQEMADLLATMFTYLPPGSSIQWTLTATPLIHDHLDRFLHTRRSPDECESADDKHAAELHQKLARNMASHYAKGASSPLIANAPYFLRNFRILMSVTIPADRHDDAELNKEITSIRETCITTLKTYHQFEKEFGPEDLIQWCAIQLNVNKTMGLAEAPPVGYDNGRQIRYQMIYPTTVVRVAEDGLRYGLPQQGDEMVAHCMSVMRYPKVCTLHAMGSIIGDYMQTALGYSCPFSITLGVVTQEFESTRGKTQLVAARSTQKADSPMARFMPELRDIKHDWDLAQKAFDEGKGTVKLYHQIVLYAKPDQVAKAEQAAQSVWRAKQFEIVDDAYMQLQGVLSSLPMMLTQPFQRDLKIAQRITTKTAVNAVNMAPLIAEWQGFGEPVIPLWGRRGQAMNIDLYSNLTGNYNACVVGASGAGKSVLLNIIALSYLGVGGRVWIIDIGRSFEKLCHIVGGQYIEFTADARIRLNPFSFVTNETFDDDMEMLLPLFCHMVSPNEPLDAYRKAQLGVHLASVFWEHGSGACIDDVAYSLVNNCEKGGPNPRQNDPEWLEKVRLMSYEEKQAYCDPRIRDMGVQLYPYCSDGPYGKFFEGQANVNFNNAFIVLELEELSSKKDLQAVIMFLLMHKITQEMYLARDQKKVCIIDEAWSLLGGGSAEFIEEGYRKARKYRGSFISGTQGVNDYFGSKASEAALNNADWMFLMRQKPESILALEESKRMMMSEETKDMLLSVKTHHGMYAEVYVHAGQMGSGIGRLLLDPFTLLLCSTQAEDYEAIMAYRRKGQTVLEAVESVLADRGMAGYTRKASRLAA